MIFNEEKPNQVPGIQPVHISNEALNGLIQVALEEGTFNSAGTPEEDEPDLLRNMHEIEIKRPDRSLKMEVDPQSHVIHHFTQTVGSREEFVCSYRLDKEGENIVEEFSIATFTSSAENAAKLGNSVDKVHGSLERARFANGETECRGHLQIFFKDTSYIIWEMMIKIDAAGNHFLQDFDQHFKLSGTDDYLSLQYVQELVADYSESEINPFAEKLAAAEALFRPFSFDFKVDKNQVLQISLSNGEWRLQSQFKEIIPQAIDRAAELFTSEAHPPLFFNFSVDVQKENA